MGEAGLPGRLIVAISGIQGVVLWLLYKALDTEIWPYGDPVATVVLVTLALLLPLLFLLAVDDDNLRPLLRDGAVLALILTAVAAYTGWQVRPFPEVPANGVYRVFAFCLAIVGFKALMYLQQRSSGQPLRYDVLFTYSWRNFLCVGFALLFTLATWSVLWLWAGLFRVINIDWFTELFREDWIAIPVSTIAFGQGIVICRGFTTIVDSVTRILQGLIRLLLPLIIVVSLVFVVALAFTGLAPLWSTGSGTAMLLWLMAVLLFAINAVYQDGRDGRPYPLPVHRLVYAGFFTLPILAALSGYGLWLRFDQYGLTVLRLWAVTVWLVLALFGAGYVAGVVMRRDEWPRMLAKVNTGMGLFVLALTLLTQSPLLDFRKIALASQLARVERGEVPVRALDFYYIKHELARPGHLALKELAASAAGDEELLALIENPPYRYAPQPVAAEDLWAGVILRPAGAEVPAALKVLMQANGQQMAIDGSVVFQVNLDGQGETEFVWINKSNPYHAMLFVASEDGTWRQRSITLARRIHDPDTAFAEILEAGTIELRAPPMKDLHIGELRYHPLP